MAPVAIQNDLANACIEHGNRTGYTGCPLVLGQNQRKAISGRNVFMPRFRKVGFVFTMLALGGVSASADDPAAIQKKLISEYALTQPTADNTDIVTGGAVLILEKSDLVLGPTTSNTSAYQNTYKDGKIQAGALAKTKSALGKLCRLELRSRP
jgi:hypothetical protein